jgi:hypothetical protein
VVLADIDGSMLVLRNVGQSRFSDLVVVAAHSLPDAEGGTKRKLQRSETPPASRRPSL